MLAHQSHVVRPDALARLVDAWSAARATGSHEAFEAVLRAEAAERSARAARVRVTLADDEAAALAAAAARAFGAHLHLLLSVPRPIEDVQRLRSASARFAEAAALPAPPAFLLDAIGASVAALAAEWAAVPARPERPREPVSRDPRWLPAEVVALAGAIGRDPIGLDDGFAALPFALDFAATFPDAGSFWDVHGSGGPDDLLERFPHPVWSRAPTTLPRVLRVGGAPARLGPSGGPITVVDAESIAELPPTTGHPAVDAWSREVVAAVAAGSAVLSWVELR